MELLDHKYKNLEKHLKNYKIILSEASDRILDQEVSNYPIFVLYRTELELGIPLESKPPGPWFVNASTLKEFVSRKIIRENKVDDFRQVYKDPRTFLCLFVLDEVGATFVFISRTKES